MSIPKHLIKVAGYGRPAADGGLNLNVRRLAQETGISAGYLSRVLSGYHTPSLDMATVLSRALDMSLDEFARWLKHVQRVRRTAARKQQQKLKRE